MSTPVSTIPQTSQEFVVRYSKNKRRRYHVMSFNSNMKVDIPSWKQIRMERENNIKEFKAEEDMPKRGAGSEFGREQREIARRKKHGIITKNYNPDDQPWVLKIGGKGGKKLRGIREGGVTENTSYYIFAEVPDGSFEAFPVSEWYNFTPVQRYKALTAEEAEEEFSRRDRVLNFFTIMHKRNKNEGDMRGEEGETKSQGSKKQGRGSSDFKISDMDDWLMDSDESDDDNEMKKEKDSDDDKKKKGKKVDKKKKKKDSSDDEANEESDEGDFDDREVDYISNSSSSESEPEEEKTNRQMKGVEDEDALRSLDLSDDEEEEPKPEVKENVEVEEVPEEKAAESKTKAKPKKPDASSGDSSSESSDSDFDDSKFHSAMFMQKHKSKNASDNSAGSSRANTPTRLLDGTKDSNKDGSRSHKRKLGDMSSHGSKKPKLDNTSGSSLFISEGITEDSVRRYLMRKPMTTTELLQKFKSKKTGMSSEKLVTTIAQILKRLNPEKQTIKGKLYLSVKPHAGH